ncbi:hypothetical protein [Lactococcus cremoris]|uniref:hypothetical protein n=1 Tax=Lactococcus lactis subsp. cremoris TaxID=1359 RepID=UPI002906C51A|nr:hypothetical protein [Lactococcus cremoris]MDU8931393.1 hypothetical protein [Lactococcus cremoris]
MFQFIGLLAAGGMINGLLSIFVKGNRLIEVIDPASSTYVIISTLAMTPFYFLPVLVGFSAAKQFHLLKLLRFTIIVLCSVFIRNPRHLLT